MASTGMRTEPRCAGLVMALRFSVRAAFVVDASGPRGFLSRALGIDERGFDGYPGTQALFSHFIDVARCDDMADFAHRLTLPSVSDR